MGDLKNMVVLIAIIAATMVRSTEGAEYPVGDSTGWIASPSGGATFYSDWASNITFRQGDILLFTFTSAHNVGELNDKASFDSCSVSQNHGVITTSPARITLNATGDFFFACTVQGHCSTGQKLSVTVVGDSPSPLPPPTQGLPPPTSGGDETPSPQSTPTEPGSTTPPPSPGSATSLLATFSPLLVAVIFLIVNV